MGNWTRWTALAVALLAFAVTGQADVVSLVGGVEVSGTITQAAIGRSIEVMVPSTGAGGARVESLDWGRVTEIRLDEVARGPDMLILDTGDRVSGTMVGSFFGSQIQFLTSENAALSYDAAAVEEIRLGIRLRSASASPASGATESVSRLVPASGLGLMFAYPGLGVTSDIIAPVTNDTLLLASLGVRVWLESDGLGFGVSNDLSYLLRIGTTYLGLGTGVLFDLSDRSWHVAINVRFVFPIAFRGSQAMLSLGFGFLL